MMRWDVLDPDDTAAQQQRMGLHGPPPGASGDAIKAAPQAPEGVPRPSAKHDVISETACLGWGIDDALWYGDD